MTRGTPPSDWVAYVVVLSTVIAMFVGKWLMVKGDKDEEISKNDKS
ncbi:MAG: hypothetical protein KAJ49_04690 [Arcobacteraceae bacterium]|nr:hypothetical protein [Arcobacteraceae bacterium]